MQFLEAREQRKRPEDVLQGVHAAHFRTMVHCELGRRRGGHHGGLHVFHVRGVFGHCDDPERNFRLAERGGRASGFGQLQKENFEL